MESIKRLEVSLRFGGPVLFDASTKIFLKKLPVNRDPLMYTSRLNPLHKLANRLGAKTIINIYEQGSKNVIREVLPSPKWRWAEIAAYRRWEVC